MHFSNKTVAVILLLASFMTGCSTSSVDNPSNGQNVSMTIHGLYPSRTGESYALWFEFPKASAGKKNQIQHGDFIKKLVSKFRVDSDGKISGFDTTGLTSKLGYSLALATNASISVEKTDSIGAEPRAPFIAGDFSGTASTGNATLVTSHDDGLNYGFTDMAGAVTLANSPGNPATDLELYLMTATSPTQTSASINNLPPLPEPWQYTLWAVDSSTKSLPPFNIYYGTFASPVAIGSVPPDSQPNDNHYPYPGGRYPADSTQPIYDLRSSGKVSVMMTVEPITNGIRPLTPFGAVILQTTILSSAQGFSPITLTNRSSQFPTAAITIHR